MGASRTKPKRCETCAFYKPGDMKGQGWCMHPKRQQSGGILLLVRARALDCRNSWGEDFWTPRGAAPEDAMSADLPIDESAPASITATAEDEPAIQPGSPAGEEDAVMTISSKHDTDDDESINQAALSDQEDRAHVMARGAREAILRARERKKERLSTARHPRVSAMPAADMGAGDWSDFDEDIAPVTEDTVLHIRHQPSVDPFRRSYDDPAPPVPSGELPADARRMVARLGEDRFETVPEVRDDFDLPRPSHLDHDARPAYAAGAADDLGDELPDNPALSSYDRVLQRARRIQRLSTSHRPQRVIRETSRVVAEPAPVEEQRYDDPRTIAGGDTAEPEPAAADQDTVVGHLAAAEPAWEADDNPFPEDENAPWLAAEALTRRSPAPQRSRFRMPQLSLWRTSGHGTAPAPDHDALSYLSDTHDDEIVSETGWSDPAPMPTEPETVDDPDWADDAVPVETYAATHHAPLPADAPPAGLDLADDEPWADDDWAEEEEAAPADDIITAEATVRHRPAPTPASFDMANLRARLFARQRAAEPQQPVQHEPAGATTPIRFHAPQDEPDPDPGPGSGAPVDRPSPVAEERGPEPYAETDFDLREVVRRQGDLLDMRIGIAPEVPRECRTCRSFRPADGGERGWCTNEWAFSHRRMVNADDLPCESSIGCWWLPRDEYLMPEDDLASLTQPTPLIDRLLGRLRDPRDDDEEEPVRARAR